MKILLDKAQSYKSLSSLKFLKKSSDIVKKRKIIKMENFRILSKKSEILKLIKNAPEGIKGEIWQSLEDKRYHYQIQKVGHDEEHQIIIFETDSKLDFITTEPVYVRIHHRNLIFKLDPNSFFIAGKKISTPYPESAKAIESRGLNRLMIPENLEIEVVLKPLGEGTNEIRVKLIDISRGGLGICIADLNKDYLQRNKFFKIVSINDIQMEGQNEIEVRYIKKIDQLNVKCGLMLKKPFVDSIYDYICKILFNQT